MTKWLQRILGGIGILILAVVGMPVYAAGTGSLKNAWTSSDQSLVLFADADTEIDKIYIGNTECKDFTLNDDALPIRTIVLVDNSLSTEAYADDITSFISNLAANIKDGDVFSVATFSEGLNYLVENGDNYNAVSEAVASLSFAKQSTRLTDVLYDLLDSLQTAVPSDECIYTRIIVMADGADHDTEKGYTQAELTDKIKSANIPIYTIGIPAGDRDNTDDLKTLFSYSRLSNGLDFMLGEDSEADAVNGITQDSNLQEIVITPSSDLCDGTVKTVRVQSGDDYSTIDLTMPFEANSERKRESSTESTTESDDTEDEVDSEIEAESIFSIIQSKLGDNALLYILIAAAAAAVLVIVLLLHHQKKSDDVPYENANNGNRNGSDEESSSEETHVLGTEQEDHKPSSDGTDVLYRQQSIKLFLQDINDPSYSFEYPIRDKILIGRSSQCQIVINYSMNVSKIHCAVVPKGNGYVVQDGVKPLKPSTNGTFVNGNRVNGEAVLPAGCILKIADVSLKVSYR